MELEDEQTEQPNSSNHLHQQRRAYYLIGASFEDFTSWLRGLGFPDLHIYSAEHQQATSALNGQLQVHHPDPPVTFNYN